MTIEFYNISYL